MLSSSTYHSISSTGVGFSFVFQFYNLMQNLTALENVELAMQICKHPLDASEVLAEVGLEERMNNFPPVLDQLLAAVLTDLRPVHQHLSGSRRIHSA